MIKNKVEITCKKINIRMIRWIYQQKDFVQGGGDSRTDGENWTTLKKSSTR